jgi:hypothetical protein
MKFAVLNPGGRDKNQTFPNGPGQPGDAGHPPVNYHAYAACLNGGFYRDESCIEDERFVLVLLRKRNLRRARSAVLALKKRGIRVLVSCKESGSHQIADLLGDVTRWELFSEICSLADAALSSTSPLVSLYQSAGAKNVICIPTPYPVQDAVWDFSTPFEKRRGIFVGTREFSVPSRNHLAAVALANQLSIELACPLAVMNSEGRRGGMILKSFQRKNPLFYIIEAPLPYGDYLDVMALHRIVWQLDSSAVPGQVAGDALLCGMPCLGGNGEIDRTVFPGLSGNQSRQELLGSARTLLTDDTAWHELMESTKALAADTISFTKTAERLKELFKQLV